MDKLKSILIGNRKAGPPVPPRPSPAAVAEALSKSRTNLFFPASLTPPISLTPATNFMNELNDVQTSQTNGRTVIFSSSSVHQNQNNQQKSNEFVKNDEANEAEGTKYDLRESSPDRRKHEVGSLVFNEFEGGKSKDNKNSINANQVIILDEHKVNKLTNGVNETIKFKASEDRKIEEDQEIVEEEVKPIVKPPVPKKSPVARPRSKPPVPEINAIIVASDHQQEKMSSMNDFIKNNVFYEEGQQNFHQSYTNLMKTNQNSLNRVQFAPKLAVTAPKEKIYLNGNQEATNNMNNLHNLKNFKNEGPESEKQKLLQEKLFTEIFINPPGGISNKNIVEANNNYVKYSDIQSKLLKRSSSCDFLNVRPDPEGSCDFSESTRIGTEKKVAFHDILIAELAEMRKTSRKYEEDNVSINGSLNRNSAQSSPDISPNGTQRSRIKNSDVIEYDKNGKKVLYSSCYISLEDSGLEDEEKLDDCSSGVGDSWDSCKDGEGRIMSLPGLPPLPKSLSGLELTQQQQNPPPSNNYHNLLQIQQQQLQQQQLTSTLNSFDSQRSLTSSSSSSISRKNSTLDTQLAVLRREMYGLRKSDLSLLSQLWTLNESIQEFRTILQDQEITSPSSSDWNLSVPNKT